MDAAVLNEGREGLPGDFPADGIKPAEEDGVRGLVDEQGNPGHRFKGADVAALAPDDPPLHLLVGNGQGGRGLLAERAGRDPLHGGEEGQLGPLLQLVFRDVEELVAHLLEILVRLGPQVFHEGFPGLRGRQLGDLEEFAVELLAPFLDPLSGALEAVLHPAHPLDAAAEFLGAGGRGAALRRGKVRGVRERGGDLPPAQPSTEQPDRSEYCREDAGGNDPRLDPEFVHVPFARGRGLPTPETMATARWNGQQKRPGTPRHTRISATVAPFRAWRGLLVLRCMGPGRERGERFFPGERNPIRWLTGESPRGPSSRPRFRFPPRTGAKGSHPVGRAGRWGCASGWSL